MAPQKKKKDIATIKVTRLRCTENVRRMGSNEIHRRIMNFRLDGRKTVQRPKLRQMDDVVEDLSKLGIQRWWMIARDRIIEEISTGSRGL